MALRDDEVGELWRQEPAQFAGPPDPGEFPRDPRLQLAVPAGNLLGTLAQFAQQPRVLDRDNRLRGEVLQQRDLLVRKRPHFLPKDIDEADNRPVLAHRHIQAGPRTAEIDQGTANWVSYTVRFVVSRIGSVDECF